MVKQYLTVFSVGPVQSFIASARKTEDLWSGSFILSHLVREAIKQLYKYGDKFSLLFPMITENEVNNPNKSNLHIASLPNRFTALLTGNSTEVTKMLKNTEAAVRHAFIHMYSQSIQLLFSDLPTKQKELLIETGKKQIESLIEIYWVIEPFEEEMEFNEIRERTESRLAAIKNDKQFIQIEQHGLTCSVCQEREALSAYPITESDSYGSMKKKLADTWNKRSQPFLQNKDNDEHARIKDNEFLCGVCTTKRLARDYFKRYYSFPTGFESFKSTIKISEPDHYYAILMIDGDNMGKWFSGAHIENYRDVSSRLATFSKETVPDIVGKSSKGMLIYAGGDDLLAFLPLNEVLDIAEKLRYSFSDDQKGLNHNATSSGGLIISHEKASLKTLLNEARKLESKAKNYKNKVSGEEKNALAIAVHTRSGEKSETVLPWNIGKAKTSQILKRIIHLLKNDLSDTFIYQFIESFYPLISVKDSSGKVDRSLIEAELSRLFKRSAKRKLSEEEVRNDVNNLVLLYDHVQSTMDFIYTLKILSFFKRKED